MTNRERFLIGGIGGLAPIVMFLVTGDLAHFFISREFMLVAIGYCVRGIILFLVGGFVVYLYQDESVRIKVFQLGLGAPAMIAGFLAASSSTSTHLPAQATASSGMFLVVHAQSTGQQRAAKQFTLPAPSPSQQFLTGLVGLRPNNVWFVIAGSFATQDSAQAYANKVNTQFSGFHAEVYAPYQDNPYYAVVVGAQLTQAQAKALRDKAVNAGLNNQTYYKTFSNLPLP